MNISDYLEQVRAKYASGQATEHSYRPALQALFESIDPALTVINEPKLSDTGMPDFLFRWGDVPIGWVEAKDVDKDVIKLEGYSVEQRQRYVKAYPNLIYTNGVDFEFIREGEVGLALNNDPISAPVWAASSNVSMRTSRRRARKSTRGGI